jgi:hypothetical protein
MVERPDYVPHTWTRGWLNRRFWPSPRGCCAARGVGMEPCRSLLDLVGLWQDLEDMLGTHVDVLSEGGVSPFLRERIYADTVVL